MTNEVGEQALYGIFASKTLARVLSQFLLYTDRRFFQTELVKLTGSKLYLVQRALERLEAAGFVEHVQEGRRVYYWARADRPGFDDLRRFFLRTFLLGDLLRELVRESARDVRLAFVYGSMASGTEAAGSDVDLMFVGEVSARDAARIAMRLQERIDREVNVSTYDAEEIAERVRADDPFMRAVIDEPKIWLIGDDDEFERIIGRE